ncbi:hypothetical protein BV898_12421 [Hypsibius exemplaris]|uniref:Meckelin n=1 Tax=Hypsibius exemplaris TaxID=2072580 RepID=A0A1W0WDN3_HYPEX|nr:hypothetical protein BV898_12421 [Hypsibius exemplaris]
MELIPAVLMAITVSCTLFVAFIYSLGWWKRQALPAPDLPFLANAVGELCGGFANAVFCTLIFTGIFENLILVTGFGFRLDRDRRGTWLADQEFLAWFLAAFGCKTVHVLYVLYRQCTLDVFIVDWEQGNTVESHAKGGCIWRTYFVANQLLLLQVTRRISPVLLFSIGYLCVTLIPGIVAIDSGEGLLLQWAMLAFNFTTPSSSSASAVVVPHLGPYYVFSVAAVTLCVAALVLLTLAVFRDRFGGNRTKEFVDMCSWLNCSIFMRTNRSFAYYVHGKSVHPTAEFGFGNLVEMIRNEEANMVSRRGLHSESESQTFSFALPAQFDALYRQVIAHLATATTLNSRSTGAVGLPKDDGTRIAFISRPFPGTPGTRYAIPPEYGRPAVSDITPPVQRSGEDASLKRRAEAHEQIGGFLQRFLDHGFKEADYVIRWRNFFESFFDVETATAGTMYYDPKMAFTEYFFIGRTFDFFVFEVLLFCTVAICTRNYACALVTVLLVSLVLTRVRAFFGHANLARKAYVYRRFLL